MAKLDLSKPMALKLHLWQKYDSAAVKVRYQP